MWLSLRVHLQFGSGFVTPGHRRIRLSTAESILVQLLIFKLNVSILKFKFDKMLHFLFILMFCAIEQFIFKQGNNNTQI